MDSTRENQQVPAPILLPVMGLRRVSFMASSWPLQLVCSVTSSHRSLGRQFQSTVVGAAGMRGQSLRPPLPRAPARLEPRVQALLEVLETARTGELGRFSFKF